MSLEVSGSGPAPSQWSADQRPAGASPTTGADGDAAGIVGLGRGTGVAAGGADGVVAPADGRGDGEVVAGSAEQAATRSAVRIETAIGRIGASFQSVVDGLGGLGVNWPV